MTFDGPTDLGDKLWDHFTTELGLPYIEKNDLCLLDEAIAMLNPPEAQLRVIEVETFLVRESASESGLGAQKIDDEAARVESGV